MFMASVLICCSWTGVLGRLRFMLFSRSLSSMLMPDCCKASCAQANCISGSLDESTNVRAFSKVVSNSSSEGGMFGGACSNLGMSIGVVPDRL